MNFQLSVVDKEYKHPITSDKISIYYTVYTNKKWAYLPMILFSKIVAKIVTELYQYQIYFYFSLPFNFTVKLMYFNVCFSQLIGKYLYITIHTFCP